MKIIHLSDLHFGTERPWLIQALAKDIEAFSPDIVVISGDLTQRATKAQYLAAKQFINEIKCPVLCVPGNHDIPLYNLFVRILFPFSKYKRWISNNLCPHLLIDNIIIVGINSVTPYKPMGGYVSMKQLHLITEFFQSQPQEMKKIVVMHHNLIRSERHKIINDAEKIISIFAKSGVNLVLSGHIHLPHIEILKRNYLSHNMYIITAGTAISYRTAAPNSYNIIELFKNEFKLSVRDFDFETFVTKSETTFPL